MAEEETEQEKDERLRNIALSLALESCAGVQFNHDYIVAIAQEFYNFLKGGKKE